MPGMDGGEIARNLKKIPETKSVPVIFLTGMFPKREESQQGRVVAGNMMFDKPYDILKLMSAIEEVSAKENAILLE